MVVLTNTTTEEILPLIKFMYTVLMAIKTEVTGSSKNEKQENTMETMFDDLEIYVDFLTYLLESVAFLKIKEEKKSVEHRESSLGESHCKTFEKDRLKPLVLSSKNGTMEPREPKTSKR